MLVRFCNHCHKYCFWRIIALKNVEIFSNFDGFFGILGGKNVLRNKLTLYKFKIHKYKKKNYLIEDQFNNICYFVPCQ